MLLTECAELAINSSDIHWYEEKGYDIPRYWSQKHKKMLVRRGTKIIVKVKDLTIGSHVKVDVACDYCGCVKNVTYKDYLKNHDDVLGDCCVKCRPVKYKETMMGRYGASNSSQVPEMVEKIKATNRAKYGCDWQMQSKEVQAKLGETMKERYGVEHALQVDEFLVKSMKTRCDNYNNPTSKPQLALSHLLLDMYGNCELERPCGRCSLDCVVAIGDILIDVEYDGKYWHQDKMRDIRRDNFVKKQGYKVLRIKGNEHDVLPTIEQIDEQMQKLLQGYNYTEIQM